jgi:hypothetical protein
MRTSENAPSTGLRTAGLRALDVEPGIAARDDLAEKARLRLRDVGRSE